jgi:hypothetical protein
VFENPYRPPRPATSGTRDGLDTHVLSIITVRVVKPRELVTLLATEATGTIPGHRVYSPFRRRRSRSKTARSSRLPSMASPPCSTRRSSSPRVQGRCDCGCRGPTDVLRICEDHNPSAIDQGPFALSCCGPRVVPHGSRAGATRPAALRLRIPRIRTRRAPAYGAGMPARLTQEVKKRSDAPDTGVVSLVARIGDSAPLLMLVVCQRAREIEERLSTGRRCTSVRSRGCSRARGAGRGVRSCS